MISLDLAKQLKEAGLKWKPNPKDDFAYKNGKVCWLYEYYPAVCDYPDHFIWLPRLDQLLAEIKCKGYTWCITDEEVGGDFRVSLSKIVWNGRGGTKLVDVDDIFYADTPEDAAGQALLWIYQKGAKEDEKI